MAILFVVVGVEMLLLEDSCVVQFHCGEAVTYRGRAFNSKFLPPKLTNDTGFPNHHTPESTHACPRIKSNFDITVFQLNHSNKLHVTNLQTTHPFSVQNGRQRR